MHSLRVNNLLKPGRVEVLPAGMLSGSNIEDAWQVITLIRQFLRGYLLYFVERVRLAILLLKKQLSLSDSGLRVCIFKSKNQI